MYVCIHTHTRTPHTHTHTHTHTGHDADGVPRLTEDRLLRAVDLGDKDNNGQLTVEELASVLLHAPSQNSVRVCVCVSACLRVCVSVCLCVCGSVGRCRHMQLSSSSKPARCLCVYARARLRACACACACACVCACMCVENQWLLNFMKLRTTRKMQTRDETCLSVLAVRAKP
jgi:hypothetical protein